MSQKIPQYSCCDGQWHHLQQENKEQCAETEGKCVWIWNRLSAGTATAVLHTSNVSEAADCCDAWYDLQHCTSQKDQNACPTAQKHNAVHRAVVHNTNVDSSTIRGAVVRLVLGAKTVHDALCAGL